MPTYPNFIQLETILKHAIEYIRAHPDSPAAQNLETLEQSQTAFLETRRETDAQYESWRKAFHDVIAEHKAVRMAYDEAREKCIEWGLEGHPNRYVSYMEEEQTQLAAEEMIGFLENCEIAQDWVETSLRRLRHTIDSACQAIAAQEIELADYKRAIRARKNGFEHCCELTRDFFSQVKNEIDRDSETYQLLTPYAW